MNLPPICSRKRAAFTLIEILASIGIISVLATIVLASLSNAKKTAGRMESMANMRQIGMGIQSFANENDGLLPGPLWGGQSPWYQSGDIRTLGYHLWPYLGLEEPKPWMQEAKILAPKAYLRARPSSNAMSFIMNDQVVIDGRVRTPWGYQTLADATPQSPPPMKVAAVLASGLASTWAMKDVDKTTPEAAPANWKVNLPSEPIYKPYRLQLYFDWHVEAIKIP